MGKGTISSNDGEGLYTVNFDYGTVGQGEVLDQLDAEIDRLNTSIIENEIIIPQFDIVIAYWRDQQDAAIVAYNANKTDANKQALKETTTWLAKALNGKDRTVAALNSLKLSLANTQHRRDYVAALPVTETKSAWCVDHTETASGEVATIEINGEPPLTLIAPGAAAYTFEYGRMHSDQLIGYSATYFNAAILPGWQKFSPTYRTGVLTAIYRESNTCDIDLDQALSSAQGLDINQTPSLSGVTFEYMTCDHAAFNSGDEVVIQFENQDWESPKVIGFKSHPKPCAPARFFFYVEADKKVIHKAEGPPVIAYIPGTGSFKVDSYSYVPPSPWGGGEGYEVTFAPSYSDSETVIEPDFRTVNERVGPDYEYTGSHPGIDDHPSTWTPYFTASPERYHRDVVIRTDCYWYQRSLSNRFLDRYQLDGENPPLYLSDGRVKIDGAYYSMDENDSSALRRYDVECVVDDTTMTIEGGGAFPGNGRGGGDWNTEVNSLDPLPTKTVDVWYYYFPVSGPSVLYFGDASGIDPGPEQTDVFDTYTNTRESYQITPDSVYQVVDENDDPIALDAQTRHDTLMEKWPMPETIEIEIDGVFHEYKLEFYGLQPGTIEPTTGGTFGSYEKTVKPANPPVESAGFSQELPQTTDYQIGNYWSRRNDGGKSFPVNSFMSVTYIRADLAD